MSLKGSLEDVGVVDLIQFIHIGGRTGTLNLHGSSQEARFGFHRGRITNVWRTGAPRLGELLVAGGSLTEQALTEALATQERDIPRRSIGQILIATGAVEQGEVKQALARQFCRLMQELVTWSQGTFDFMLDELLPLEELADFPGDVAPKVELDTQTVLLDVLGHLEEIRRSGEHPAAPNGDDDFMAEFTPSDTEKTAVASLGLRVPVSPLDAPSPASRAFPRIQLVTVDANLVQRLRESLRMEGARVAAVAAGQAGSSLPGEPPPIVVMDLRSSGLNVESIRVLHRTRPKVSVVAYCVPQTVQARIYEAGAAAVVHGDERALAACLESVFRTRGELSSEALIAEGLRDGFARLRRIVNELRAGLLSTTVSLNLMNVVAESLERAILFVIQQEDLIPIGSFGLASSGKSFSEMTRGMQLSLRERSVFSECVGSGRSKLASYQEGSLPESFRTVVNRPRTGEFAVLPVSGSQRVIAVIYVDNGAADRGIADLPVLELAAFQLGLALENEFLRRAQATRRAGDGRVATLRNVS